MTDDQHFPSMPCLVWRLGARIMQLLLIFTLPLANLNAQTHNTINTDPNKLIGKTILFFKLDHADVQLLEPACVVPLTNGGNEVGMWYELTRNHPILNDPRYHILKGADSIHHYCRGQAAKIRYFRERDRFMQRRLLEEMIGEYEFMINNPQWLPPNWPYMKIMHFELANAKILEKKPAMALQSYEKALSLDAGYEQARIGIIDVLTDLGRKNSALEHAAEGLRHNQNSKGLQRRYLALGGTMPYPEPYLQAHQSPSQPPPALPLNPTETIQDPMAGSEHRNSRISEDSFSEPAAAPTSVSPEIGTESNPYCRFCP